LSKKARETELGNNGVQVGLGHGEERNKVRERRYNIIIVRCEQRR
jgi:hypothetical protein